MGFDITGLGSIFDFGSKVIDKIWPDQTEAEKAKVKLYELQQAGAFKELEADVQLRVEQIKVNALEAQSADPYTSRWRPTVGYVCCIALAWNFIAHPMLVWYMTMWKPGVTPPPAPGKRTPGTRSGNVRDWGAKDIRARKRRYTSRKIE